MHPRFGLSLLLALATCAAPGSREPARTLGDRPAHPEQLARAVERIERLDHLRSSLASTFDDTTARPDRAMFLLVCEPVGVEAARIARENGWIVEQLATKYRDPAHEADPEARRVVERFERNPDLDGQWIRTERDGTPGTRYFRRIVVEAPCLTCHGAKDARPDFVKEGYPQDRAFGFEVGDLRGVYAVFVPDSTSASEAGGAGRDGA